MFKKSILGGLILVFVLTGGIKDAFGDVKPNCEIGDAVFRNGRFWFNIKGVNIPVGFFGHVGIYASSQSDRDNITIGTEDPYPIQIDESDLKYGVIAGNGYGTSTWPPGIEEVDYVPFEFFRYGEPYWGAYNCGKKLSADDRRQIVATAYQQKLNKAKYATGNPERKINGRPERPEDVKNPTGKPPTFRCDGLVEYCYEVMV